jgi:NAD(P)H dehydrogenase (quinone)
LNTKALVVLAHPGERSLSRHFAEVALEELAKAGHDVKLLDLCKSAFDPVMGGVERTNYYSDRPDHPKETEQLAGAEFMVLAFPTWWFGMPAILKGWIDRVFAPAIAFDHADKFGRIKPRLTKLRHVVIVTTLGSPWWVDWLVMFRPVRRTLKRAVFGLCAPKATFQMISFYAAENADARRVEDFSERLRDLCRL